MATSARVPYLKYGYSFFKKRKTDSSEHSSDLPPLTFSKCFIKAYKASQDREVNESGPSIHLT